MVQDNDIKKEARQQRRDLRREARRGARDDKRMQKDLYKTKLAKEQVYREAGEQGIDLGNIVKTPITDTDKQAITKGIKGGVAEEFHHDLDAFEKTYAPPVMEDMPRLNEQALIESAKRQRRKRWADALYAFGSGYKGRFDPSKTAKGQLEAERRSQFEQYRDVTERNKKSREAWEGRYRNDLLNFAREKQKEADLDYRERKRYEMMEKQLLDQKARFDKEFGLKEREFKLKEEGKWPTSGTSSENDPTYLLRKNEFLLKMRQQKGKEAAEKLENNLKALELDLDSAESNLITLRKERSTYEDEAGWKKSDEEKAKLAEYDKTISDEEAKIASMRENMSQLLKDSNAPINEPTGDPDIDKFFGGDKKEE